MAKIRTLKREQIPGEERGFLMTGEGEPGVSRDVLTREGGRDSFRTEREGVAVTTRTPSPALFRTVEQTPTAFGAGQMRGDVSDLKPGEFQVQVPVRAPAARTPVPTQIGKIRVPTAGQPTEAAQARGAALTERRLFQAARGIGPSETGRTEAAREEVAAQQKIADRRAHELALARAPGQASVEAAGIKAEADKLIAETNAGSREAVATIAANANVLGNALSANAQRFGAEEATRRHFAALEQDMKKFGLSQEEAHRVRQFTARIEAGKAIISGNRELAESLIEAGGLATGGDDKSTRKFGDVIRAMGSAAAGISGAAEGLAPPEQGDGVNLDDPQTESAFNAAMAAIEADDKAIKQGLPRRLNHFQRARLQAEVDEINAAFKKRRTAR
jgi:hypothetical protein